MSQESEPMPAAIAAIGTARANSGLANLVAYASTVVAAPVNGPNAACIASIGNESYKDRQ
jgi:hypothetical protein